MPRSHQLGKLAEKRALNYLLQKRDTVCVKPITAFVKPKST